MEFCKVAYNKILEHIFFKSKRTLCLETFIGINHLSIANIKAHWLKLMEEKLISLNIYSNICVIDLFHIRSVNINLMEKMQRVKIIVLIYLVFLI